MILVSISLIICNVEHLFNCISSMEEISIKIFCSFFIGLFVFQILSCMRHLYVFDVNLLSYHLQIFSPIHSPGCLFILLKIYFVVQKIFKFNWAPFVYFCSCFLCLESNLNMYSYDYVKQHSFSLLFLPCFYGFQSYSQVFNPF